MRDVAAAALPWKRGMLWLLFLGPFFFASYGFANWATLQRGDAGVLAFGWERAIPFLPWTIVPYWSIDLLYGLSFLACRTDREVDRHGLRLLTVQLVAVACFLSFPLRFSFERPATEGAFGAWFAALASFDQPFNQAPSLHIALLVLIWTRFAPRLRGLPGVLAHAWLALIGVSVLTTWQHHFIDLPTGALLGFVALWLWPDDSPSPLARVAWTKASDRRRLARRYALGALAAMGPAVALGGGGLWLLWPAFALGLVSLAYAALGAEAFQKRDATPTPAAAVLLAPYTLGAWVNSRLWTRRRPAPDHVLDGVWIGRMPTAGEMRRRPFRTLVDLAAELPAPRGPWRYAGFPWLDLVAPDAAALAAAAGAIEAARADGDVLVVCALGYGRSAAAVAAWLVLTGRADDARAALTIVRARRPGAALDEGHRAALERLLPVTP